MCRGFLTRLSYEHSPREIMILRTLKTRWCDNISYPQHVREVAGGLTRLRFVISMADLRKLLEVITLARVYMRSLHDSL